MGQRTERERPAHSGADSYLALGRACAKSDRDEGDDTLGQRGPERRENRPGRRLAHIEPRPDPLDAVHEELAGEVDEDGRAEEHEQGKRHIGPAGWSRDQ